ncbi:hypothetical protein [Tenacibaculum finnmarkense]|uniref:hypothetical protein n=1 Tax=Tenacibaculum finnmarkense TaxID=2781243 RepID=UPI001E36D3C7|nr:hypothetical protein [Tenacibaculum finnmarkense]MCD8411091.1 hypothetical protein [Tenacibaculum finnmarkense genomovar ulcerans]MCG8734682.1 hypothetical protein [Tenacibaculum finnmarkense]MCG8859999.1 hypothetical protein [Tenacibaculum finnmarkense]WCC41498.1 hypothetical protein PJJ26_08355 [Tenacibaculum finnmarkense]
MKQTIPITTDSFSQLVEEINILESKNLIDWSELCKNISIEIDLDLFVIIYKTKIDWTSLSKCTSANFTEKFILKNKDKIKWNGKQGGNGHKFSWRKLGGFCSNLNFPIEKKFIKKVIDFVDWRDLGMNPSLKIYDPESLYGSESCNSDYERQIPIFETLISYWDKWEKEGSYWHDGNLLTSGYNNDSIYDNENIDWEFFKKHKFDYQNWIKNENSRNQNLNDDLPF